MKGRVGKIVEEFKIGNTTIKINDAYMVTDQEEIDRILDRIANIVMNAYAAGRVIDEVKFNREDNPYLSVDTNV
ncbi:hypothetical protein [Tissierella sp. Yu-01]|uniref:hypothetical protein n=1 Tax=Tissierella sp. Yu-01 TaxID=3035694 RepID=UPI00240E512C|nr:hypothetical protein [Tissierella sp. Yu-01]WFA10372.1 hypothetical protein P3962_07410 [Tissierella sp. Yu-01]